LGVNINVNFFGQVQIAAIGTNSAAENADLLVGDVILEMNGAAISSFADLRRILDAASPGDKMELRIKRGSDELTLIAVLDEYRPYQAG
jgi:S1-C subfamily serine protease